MIIIVEGFDRSGKTTLCDLICEKTKIKKFKSSFEIFSKIDLEEAIKHDWRFVLDILSQVEFDIVFDRSFISQYVYSKILRIDNVIHQFKSIGNYDNMFKLYCDKLENIKHLIVYCERQNYIGVIDDKIDVSLNRIAKMEYNVFIAKFCAKLNVIRCNFENGIDNNMNVLETTLKTMVNI